MGPFLPKLHIAQIYRLCFIFFYSIFYYFLLFFIHLCVLFFFVCRNLTGNSQIFGEVPSELALMDSVILFVS